VIFYCFIIGFVHFLALKTEAGLKTLSFDFHEKINKN